jgi:hypothetical protein
VQQDAVPAAVDEAVLSRNEVNWRTCGESDGDLPVPEIVDPFDSSFTLEPGATVEAANIPLQSAEASEGATDCAEQPQEPKPGTDRWGHRGHSEDDDIWKEIFFGSQLKGLHYRVK